ncbi:MAG: hypothetical protein HN590_13480 [Calditrichaeota bacterium]|nr:hypothetical protein [Calditrichota bacterium]
MSRRFDSIPDPNLQIAITLDDNRYHRLLCNCIMGDTLITELQNARNRYSEPCPACFREEAGLKNY